MEPVIQKFRSALGGFHRRDVMQYIEQSAAAHRRQIAALQEQLDRSEQERAQLERTLASVRDQHGSTAAEEARVRASLEESTETLTKLRGELEQTESQLAGARGELEQLQAQVQELAPMARNYDELKDRVATVELDAHRKAQATLDEARQQAEAIREESRLWVEQVTAQYADVRRELEGIFGHSRALARLEEQAADVDSKAAALREKAGLE